MESFALAETFKYFYVLFAPLGTLDFRRDHFQYGSPSAQAHLVSSEASKSRADEFPVEAAVSAALSLSLAK